MAKDTTSPTMADNTAVNLRIKISGLWTSLLFVFAYVDIFGLLRADVLNGLLAGKVHTFAVDQGFLFMTTLYVTIPSLMIFLSLVLAPRINRWANIVIAVIYAITIAGSCLDETWIYFWFGSAVELVLLGFIIRYAWQHPSSLAQASRIS